MKMVPFLVFGILAVIMSAGVGCDNLPLVSEEPSQCFLNSDCAHDLACYKHHCINPCETDICALNAECSVVNHLPKCNCIAGFHGDPYNGGCSNRPIIIRNVPKQACNPSECGPNAMCYEKNGDDACRCKPGYRGSISFGCVQCETKFNCDVNQTCIGLECVDLCPGDCGPNEVCYVFNHKSSCRPKDSHPECTSDTDCASDKACDGYKCIDPCLDLCNNHSADCQVVNQKPICTCKPGFYGSPYRFCLADGVEE